MADLKSIEPEYNTVKDLIATADENGKMNELLSNEVFLHFLSDLYDVVVNKKGGEIFSTYYEMFATAVFVRVIANSVSNNMEADRLYNVVGAFKNNSNKWTHLDEWQNIDGSKKPWLRPWAQISQFLADWETRFANKDNPLKTKKYDRWSDMSEEEQEAIIKGFLAKATQNAFDRVNKLKKNFEASISNDEEFSSILTDQLEGLFKNDLHMDMNQDNLSEMLGSLANYYGTDDENKELVSNIRFIKDIIDNYGKNLKVLNKKDDNIEGIADGGAPTNNVNEKKPEEEQQSQEANADQQQQ